MDEYQFSDSETDSDFDGFNSSDIDGAERRQQTLLDHGDSNSSESDLNDDSDSDSEHDDDDTASGNYSDDDVCVPNLKENPIQWSENFRTFDVPSFTCPSGPSLPTNWNPKASPRDYFQLFWTDDLLNNTVRYTNQYAKLAIMRKRRHQPDYVDKEWASNGSNDITYKELCAYMGVNIILSVNPYHQLKHVFSADPFLSNGGIRNVFTLKRFTKIGNYFCVSDKLCEPPKDSPSYDKLYKVRPVIEQMNHLFPHYYKFSSHQAIDESTIKTKSRDCMRNFNKCKPSKWGFRVCRASSNRNGQKNRKIGIRAPKK